MITFLSVQHYRSVESLNLRLGPVNVLVGQNGAGKSNIIDAIKLVRDSLRDGLDQAITSRHGIQSMRQWSPTRPYNISIKVGVTVDDWSFKGSGEYGFTISSSKENYNIQREEMTWRGAFHVYERVGSRRKKREIHQNTRISREKDEIIIYQDGVQTETEGVESEEELIGGSRMSFSEGYALIRHLLEFESYTIFPNTLREPQKQSNEEYLTSHGENLASIIKRMRAKKKNESIAEIIAGMQKVIPDLDNITAQAIGGYIVPRFFVKPDDKRRHAFDVNQMSDGTLRVLGILVALYQEPGPAMIALEEPELTVHPGLLQLLAEAIKEVSEERQIFITTHSPEFLDHFDPQEIIAVEFEDGVTKARPLSAGQKKAVQMELFRLGELMTIEGLHG